jgi:hypothetical protein
MIEGYKQMVTDLAKPGQAIVDSMSAERAHCLHMAVGLVGEVAGELPVSTSMENLIEELGDVEFYFEGLMQAYTIPALLDVPEGINPDLSKLPSILALVVIAGDIMDVVKKHVIYGKEVDMLKLVNNMSAFRQILNAIEGGMGEDISQGIILEANMQKLLKGETARYKSGSYSDDQATDRADKASNVVNINKNKD